jgi:hypothetical protein
LTVQNRGTYNDKFQIYVPEDKKELVLKVKFMFEREGSSISKFIIKQLEDYYRLHEPGNPQQLLDRYENGKKAYVAADPCFFNCGRPSEFLASYSKEDRLYKVCKVHAHCIEKNMLQRNFQFLRWRIVSSIEKI